MATWESFFDDVMPEVPGALTPVVAHAIKRAAQEFFQRSKVWKTDVTITAQAGVPNYVLDAGDQLSPGEVISAQSLKIHLTDEDMEAAYGNDWRQATGPAIALFQTMPGSVRLYPAPDENGQAVVLSVSVYPSDEATGIPDDLAVRYRKGIASGALASLMLSSKKPYSDPNLGIDHRAKFEAAIGQAISDRASGFGLARSRRVVGWH